MSQSAPNFALRTSLIYAVVAAAWIGVSDWALTLVAGDPGLIAKLSVAKGWMFVGITSVLLYALVRRSLVRQQRALERKLKLQEEVRRWADAFTHCSHGLALGDPSSNRITACNPAFAAMHGCLPETINGTCFLDLYMPDDHAKVCGWALEADRVGRAQFEAMRRRVDGSTFASQMDLVSVRGTQGEILYRVATMQDITARKTAESALRQSEERFRAVVENIQEVFWVTDPKSGCVTYISPAFEAIWGRNSSEVVGQPAEAWLKTLHPDDCARMAALGVTQNEKGYNEQYRVQRPDGTVRWVHDQAFVVKDEAGEVVRVVGVAQDITERKLLEGQFLRAQRMEAIGTLAGGVAHDLNNILAPMLMAAGLIKENVTDEHDRAMLSLVERSARRGAEIVRQLLTFSRGVEGARVPLQARHLIKEMGGIIRETFPREIKLVDHTPNDLWPVVADATQVHQVLVNLCVNARDAMPEGGRLSMGAENVEIKPEDPPLTRDARPGRYVMLTVADTGLGMPPQVMEQIFDPFFTTKELGKGTGLGLSTVLGIVRSHRGFITVQSTPGAGSTFRVYLPAGPVAPDETPAEQVEPLPVGVGETILVVDDEEAIREATRHLLEKQNYRVVTAKDGKEAVQTFVTERGAVRLVLTDLMMPEMGGAALIRALRLLNPELKVIATSGLGPDGKQLELDELGITEILPKPCSSKALLDAIHRVLPSVPRVAQHA